MLDLTGNPAIDTAIGLAFAYFLLSLVVSSLTEAVSSVLQLRWRTLQRGIRELLLEGGDKNKDVLKTLDKINQALTALDRGDLRNLKKAKKYLEKADKKIAKDAKDKAPISKALKDLTQALAALTQGEPAAGKIAKDVGRTTTVEDLRKELERSLRVVTKFENNERIKALWKQTGFLATLPLIGNRGPSYIEPRVFALTLLETLGITDEKQGDTETAAQTTGTQTPWVKPRSDDLVLNATKAVNGVENPVLQKWLRDALTEAKGERDKLLASIESSFDAMTNRISGWYKRYATIWIVLIAIAVAGALNADSYAMGSRLWKDQAVRSALVAQADKLVDPATCDVKKTQSEQAGGSPTSTTTTTPTTTESTETTPTTTESTGTTPTTTESTTTVPTTTSPSNRTGASASNPAEEAKTAIQRASDCVAAVKALGLPLGWAQENRPDTGLGWLAKFGGIVITVFALMLGAPFWFDTLSKLARLRATGKPEGTGTKSE